MNQTTAGLARLLAECMPDTRRAVDRAGCLDRPYFDWFRADLEISRAKVRDWIISQPGYVPGLMIPNGGGGEIFDDSAAQALLALSIKFGVEKTAAWYSALLSEKPTTGLTIWLVQGVKSTREIALTKHVSLMPVSAIPASRMTEDAANFVLSEHRPANPYSPTLASLSAVVESYVFDQRLVPNGSNFPKAAQNPTGLIMEGLSLVGPSSVRPVRQWSQTADPMFEFVRGGSGYGQLHQELSWPVGAPEAYLSESSVGLVQGYVTLAEKHPHLSISVQRLGAALRRMRPTDRAIELGTALESAIAGDTTTEITYRLSLRVARLLGADVTQRRAIRSTMKAFYSMRSAAVHSGKVSLDYKVSGQPPMPATALADAAQSYLVDCLRLFVEQGSIPDWDTLELS